MSKHRRRKPKNTLHQQAYDRLTAMMDKGIGKSKDFDKKTKGGSPYGKIYSYNTYHTYWQQCKQYVKDVRQNHPECRNLDDARPFVEEHLQKRMDKGQSAWTVWTAAQALCKLFGIHTGDLNIKLPERKRADIKRSRNDVERDNHFSEYNNRDLIHFSEGTGLRKSEMAELRGSDLVTQEQIQSEINSKQNEPGFARSRHGKALMNAAKFKDHPYFIHVRNGKGGRERYVPISAAHQDEIVSRMQATQPGDKVWDKIHDNADIHSYRAQYAANLYKSYARDIKDIPFDSYTKAGHKKQSDVYACRKDLAGLKLDRKAMDMVSLALGHSRDDVVAQSYMYLLK